MVDNLGKDVRLARVTTEKKAKETFTTVPAAARTLALFEVFAREKRPLSKSELARLLDLPESSCSDLLNTIHSLGFVSRTVSTRRYYPTSRLHQISSAVAEGDALGLIAAEATSKLSQLTDETCTFGVIDGDSVKMVAVVQGTHRLRYVAQSGDSVSLHGTSVGKALLSELPPEEMGRLLRLKPLKQRTGNTITDPKELARRIDQERSQGWFSAMDEATDGVSSYAIAGRFGSDPAAMSIVGPTSRLLEHRDRFAHLLQEMKVEVFAPR